MNIENVGHKNIVSMTPDEALQLCLELLKQYQYASVLGSFASHTVPIIGKRQSRGAPKDYPEVLQFNIEGKPK